MKSRHVQVTYLIFFLFKSILSCIKPKIKKRILYIKKYFNFRYIKPVSVDIYIKVSSSSTEGSILKGLAESLSVCKIKKLGLAKIPLQSRVILIYS